MPPQAYLTTSTRSSPSPPPDSSISCAANTFTSQTPVPHVRRRGRPTSQSGMTPIRPTFDYSTTNSYLGGESTVDNDSTDCGARRAQSFGRLRRTPSANLNVTKNAPNSPHFENQELRGQNSVERRVTVPHRRESPHPQTNYGRSGGPLALSSRQHSLFPDVILFGPLVLDARQCGEYTLLIGAVVLAAWRLFSVGEWRTASVLVGILVCSLIYEFGWLFLKCFIRPKTCSPEVASAGTHERVYRRFRTAATPPRGYIWMTDEKNYRECSDNGEITGTLLGPLIVASALYASIRPPSSLVFTSNWHMEGALALVQKQGLDHAQAMVLSRKALVQCISLNTIILIIHMYASSHLRNWPRPDNTPHPARRVALFAGFSCCLTAATYVLYETSRAVGWRFLNEVSRFDLLCSTLFFQISLYVMIRMARRAFTLGEVVLVAHGATALFLEAVNISIIKQWPASGKYVKTFREPSPLLVFQLALLPGSLLIGFLLSPLLALSRHIARRPRLRLRAPHQTEQLIYRRMLAIGLASGAVLLVGGLLGGWARWLLGGRDPWLWVLRNLTKGRRSWSRIALVAWWGLLGSLSVAGWNRQLARSRRRSLINMLTSPSQTPIQTQFKQKSTVAQSPMSEVSAVGTYPPLVPRLGTQLSKPQPASGKSSAPVGQTRDIQAVATDLLDAADKHVPTLSRNGRRKFFHALAVLMFVPGISWDPAFTHLSFSLAFSLFTFAEYIRYFAIYPFGAAVHVFLSEFLDEKDSGTAILSHFYLLTGCAMPLWLESSSRVLGLAGVVVLGVGDALASIVGKRFGLTRWFPSCSKTIEGTATFILSTLAFSWIIAAREFGSVDINHLTCAVLVTGLLEAVSKQNDNLIIPLYMWCMMVLLPVEACKT